MVARRFRHNRDKLGPVLSIRAVNLQELLSVRIKHRDFYINALLLDHNVYEFSGDERRLILTRLTCPKLIFNRRARIEPAWQLNRLLCERRSVIGARGARRFKQNL